MYNGLIVSLLINCWNSSVVLGQGIYYQEYLPFDSSGTFVEKVIMPLDTTIFINRSLARLKKDSSSLDRLYYLTRLLEENERLVISALLYDDFHLSDNSIYSGGNYKNFRAKAILSKLLKLGVDPFRMDFHFCYRTREGLVNSELMSEYNRLELIVFELPSIR